MNNICPNCEKEVQPCENSFAMKEKIYCNSKCRSAYLRKERLDKWYFNPLIESEPTKGGKHSERY